MRFGIDQLQIEATSRATLRAFVASWHEHRNPVLFVGAGFSQFQAKRRQDVAGNSRFGSWDDLMREFAEQLSDRDQKITERLPKDPLRLAQHFESQFGRAALLDCVARQVPSADFLPGRAHDQLRLVPWAAIVTTNYDDLLERTFERSRAVRRIVEDGDLTQRRTLDDLAIIKMHGDLSVRETVVLTEEDYRRYESKRPGLSVKIRQLLLEHPLIFVGFSLSDPNFSKIDGWIRDTVGSVRLPSVAIVHAQPLDADRSMWKSRGIELVQLPSGEPMERLLSAIARERLSKPPLPSSRNSAVKLYEFEDRIRILAASETTSLDAKSHSVASLLAHEILPSVDPDGESGEALRQLGLHIAWGWPSALRPAAAFARQEGAPLANEKGPSPTMRSILAKLSPQHQRQLLMLVLEAGELSLRSGDGDNDIDAPTELAKLGLSPDEEGLVALFQAKIFRELGDGPSAKAAVERARKADPSKAIRARVTIESRELSFIEGDAAGLQSELSRPLDEGSDVLAMCRRGSDALLLGRVDEADRWYSDALERADSGDARYVALLGRRGARLRDLLSNDAGNLADELHSIPLAERPQTVAADAVVESAGRALLEGRPTEEVVRKLRAYLEALRLLGSPHSHSHNATFPVESAARQAARLLLSGGSDAPRAAEHVKQALVLLNCYGLATDVGKLFTREHCEILARTTEGILWLRRFAAVSSTLPRAIDARMTTTLAAIPLLEDAVIAVTVKTTIRHTDAALADDIDAQTLLDPWWTLLARNAQHLPGPAISQLLASLARYIQNPRACFRVDPARFFGAFSLWRDGGQLGAASAGALVAGALDGISSPQIRKDARWLRTLTSVVLGLSGVGLLAKGDLAGFAEAADTILDVESANLSDGGFNALHLARVVLLHNRKSEGLKVLARNATDVARRNLRSTSLGLALGCLDDLIPIIKRSERANLATLLIEEIVQRPHDDNRVGDSAAIARTLGALARRDVTHRPVIVEALKDWLEIEPAALAGFDRRVREFSGTGSPELILHAIQALIRAPGTRRTEAIYYAMDWVREQPHVAALRPVLEVVLGLAASDIADTRRAAIAAIGLYFSRHSQVASAFGTRAVILAKTLATSDTDSRVRAAAIFALPRICRDTPNVAMAREIASAASVSGVIALERRAGEIAMTRLRRARPRA